MARKTKFKPQSWEKVGSSNLSTVIYASMLQSAAWQQLTNNARVLYIYMKLQLYGAKTIENQGPDCFYFNWALCSKTYNLYKNRNQFIKDTELLVKYGFIEVLEHGKNTRTKNIYKFSDKWQTYT